TRPRLIPTLFPYTTLFRSDKIVGMSRDLLREYISYIKVEKGLAKNSVDSYRRDLRKLSDWCEKNGFDIAKLERGDIREWLIDLRSEEHTSELQSRENLVCR